jgi:chromosome segregation protein
MLKALELSGFKSFADRTRFEFPRGICIVVGPNGSGKSNIVDAVKWVLGSQSAKSLRGKEMTDVIFNGCASRAPLGTGEATLTLANDDGRLPIDAKEVHITRRVYRSGEGEYLLNRQPCRLRDIREVLAGTGITTEAYCIIEQGKVDALLQSSPRDRRIIFEEAAGISQFKAKKAVAMRRLERVEQNLLRLSDIVDEVESRLRSVRSQAGKARRYRECSDRLQHLRTQIGLVDWRKLTAQIASRESQLADLARRVEERSALLEKAEGTLQELERRVESGIQRLRETEAAAAATREQIAARQATIENHRARHAELEEETNRIRQQLAAMSTRTDGAVDEFHDAAHELQVAEAALAAAAEDRQLHFRLAEEAQRELDQSRSKLSQTEAQLAETTRRVALLTEQHNSLDVQLQAARAAQEELRVRSTDLHSERERLLPELQQCEEAETGLKSESQAHQVALSKAEQRLAQARNELARVDRQHRALEAAATRVRERIAVLSELEHRLEGLDGGVQELLRMARDAAGQSFGEVLGVVADLFHVDVDTAPLLEVALGERAQFIVLASANRLLERLQLQPLGVTGRVGFLRLDTRPSPTALDHVDLESEAGVMGRADRFVEAALEYRALASRLLGRTWLVDRLSTALRLSQTTGRGLEFVTSDGELLAADGTLVIGPRLAAAGIMSRRSELRACHEQALDLDQQIENIASVHAKFDQERMQQEAIVASSAAACSQLAAKLADSCQKTAFQRGRMERIVHQHADAENDLRLTAKRMAEILAERESINCQRLQAEQNAEQLQAEWTSAREAFTKLQQSHAELQLAVTERQVIAAKSEQRVEMLRQQLQLAERNQHVRDRALDDTRQRLATLQMQLADMDKSMLASRQALAELFLRKDEHAEQLASLAVEDESVRRERIALAEQIRARRHELGTVQSQRHKVDVAASSFRHERQTLAERMHDDYGIDLATVADIDSQPGATIPGEPGASATGGRHSVADAPGQPESFDRNAIEREIAELRHQINNIGAVNLEALDELDQMEQRFARLSGQYRDLVDAKASLERITHRINADSRQLFLATLEAVRGHFQELFRRLFGGGEADILVDEAEDVLECGIEIIARPPGKEACSISLLSGGEKTLTCVALLLAVFRSKPSPFCVLDEVDAALDEANIGRFIAVLRDFLSFTQFVVVTHSKKTMAGADTLYGVTMEESGVSKRVSVRFEDVSEDGQILLGPQRLANASIDDDPVSRAA